MAKRFDPATLFERWRHDPTIHPYRTDAAELAAVRAGAKPMSMFHVDLEPGARTRGLVVERQGERVYVARPEERWRIPAHVALWETALEAGPWCDQSEALEGYLLGYTRAQRRAWIAHVRQRQAAWGSPTVYTLLDRAQRRRIAALGHRCFGDAGGLALFRSDGVLRQDALRRVPAGLTLARVALRRPVLERLFGDRRRATVPASLSAALNAALASNVQVLIRSGWRG